jgi:ATP synthase protein I
MAPVASACTKGLSFREPSGVLRIVAENGPRDRPGTQASQSSFEERLMTAERRAGVSSPSETGGNAGRKGSDGLSRQDFTALGLVFRLGTELVSALVVGVAIGYGLDRWLGHRPLFLVTFSLLGGVAGVMNVWRFASKAGPN